MAEFPKPNDPEFILIKKICENTAEFATTLAGDVSKITAGTGISISPASGIGNVTINSTVSGVLPTQTGNAGKALTTDGTTASWSSSLTALNTITSTALSDLALKTGTSGLGVTFTSATGAATFAAGISGTTGAFSGNVSMFDLLSMGVGSASGDTIGIGLNRNMINGAIYQSARYAYALTRSASDLFSLEQYNGSGTFLRNVFQSDTSGNVTFAAAVTVSGSILGSGGSAPTSTTTGSNVFTAGIATSGPGFFGGNVVTSGQIDGTGSSLALTTTATNSTFRIDVLPSGSGVNASQTFYNNSAAGSAAYGVIGITGTGNNKDLWISTGANGAAAQGDVNIQGLNQVNFKNTTEATTVGAGSLTTAGGGFVAKTHISKHIGGYGTSPTGAVGTGAGTSPSAVTFDANANDIGGVVNVTTGTLPTAAATVLTVTFNGAYANTPHVTLFPNNAATALLSGITMVYTTAATGTFVITAGSTGLVAATAYSWTYHVIQ